MKNRVKKLLAFLMTLSMVFQMMPVNAFAGDIAKTFTVKFDELPVGFNLEANNYYVAYEIESQFEGIQEAFDEINKNSEKMTHQRSVTSC